MMLKMLCGLSFLLVSLNSLAQFDSTFNKNLPPGIYIKTIPFDYYTQKQGWFCTKEFLFQKNTGLNLYLRLGNKDYVDYLERKPNSKRF
jgi:hypothetical protein